MTDIVEMLWPSAYQEVKGQLDVLQQALAQPDPATLDSTRVYKLFHTMKTTMAMVQVSALHSLFYQCELWWRDQAERAQAVTADAVAVLQEVTCWAEQALEQAYHQRSQPDVDAGLQARIEQLHAA